MNKLLTKLLPISLLVLIVGLLAWRALPNSAITKLTTNQDTELLANLTTTPEWPVAGGPTALAIDIRNTDGSAAQLMRHHARRVHSLIVSDDFSVFGHIHPEDFSSESSNIESEMHTGMNHNMPMDMPIDMPVNAAGSAAANSQHSLRFRFPQSGNYLVGVDVMSAESALSQIWRLNVGAKKSPLTTTEKSPKHNGSLTRCFVGYQETGPDRYAEPVMFDDAEVSCDHPEAYRVALANTPELIRAGASFKLSFNISKNGGALTTLQPYLAAALHLAIVPTSFDNISHHHGVPDNENDAKSMAMAMAMSQGNDSDAPNSTSMHHMHMGHGQPLPEAFGPRLISEPLQLAAAGNYWLFAQFKHNNHIVFTRFPLKVEPGFADADAKKIAFTLNNQQLSPTNASVQQGDNVILQINSDVAGDFHLTGYELEQPLQPNKTVEMRFTAAHSGMFGIELHPANNPDIDIPLGSLQVQPN